MGKIKVSVPATTANLGPGFDTLGCALRLYNTFTFELTDSGLIITGCDKKYADPDNLCYTAFRKTYEKLGLPLPPGLKIDIDALVPVSRGLGSSSTLLVAGAMAANYFAGSPLSKKDILSITNELEGHPDNVAPAIFGGLVASAVRSGRPLYVRYSVSPDILFTAVVPDFETSTEEARAVLPHDIPRLDAVYTVGCLALLLKALETGDRDAISAALDDRLHQPYRKKMIDEYDEVRGAALAEGCDGFIISGSGSTCLCVGGDKEFARRLQEKLKSLKHSWKVYPLEIDECGARLFEEEQNAE